MNVMCVSLLYIHRTAPAVSYKSHTNERHSWLSFYTRNSFVSVKSHSYKQIKKYKMLFLCFVRCVVCFVLPFFFVCGAKMKKRKSSTHFSRETRWKEQRIKLWAQAIFLLHFHMMLSMWKGEPFFFLFFIYIIDLFHWKCTKFESEYFDIDVENMMKNVLSWRSINRTNTSIF